MEANHMHQLLYWNVSTVHMFYNINFLFIILCEFVVAYFILLFNNNCKVFNIFMRIAGILCGGNAHDLLIRFNLMNKIQSSHYMLF